MQVRSEQKYMYFALLIIHTVKFNLLQNDISSSVFTGYSEEYQQFLSCLTVNHLSCHHPRCESVLTVETYIKVKVYFVFFKCLKHPL